MDGAEEIDRRILVLHHPQRGVGVGYGDRGRRRLGRLGGRGDIAARGHRALREGNDRTGGGKRFEPSFHGKASRHGPLWPVEGKREGEKRAGCQRNFSHIHTAAFTISDRKKSSIASTGGAMPARSEEHTYELQSPMPNSY